MKRSLAVFLTVFLIITMCIPAFAAEKECEPPLASDFGSGSTTSESVTPSDSVKNERPTLVVTQEPIYPNWRLWATLPEVASDTVEYITPYYSFDGEAFTVGERLSYANFSGLAIEPNVEPMNSFTEGRADEFWIYLQIEGTDYNGSSQTCKVLRNTEVPELPTPEPEKITARVEHAATGWRLPVTLPYSVRVGTKLISPEYSFGGTSFSSATDIYGNPIIWEDIFQEEGVRFDRQYLGAKTQPMKSFVEKECDQFYFRMNIKGDNYNGYSDVYLIERTLDTQPIPKNSEILACLPQSSEVKTSRPPSQRGLFNVTVREGASRDTLLSYLPTVLPVTANMQSVPDTAQAYLESEGTMYGVNWKLPQGLPQDGIFKECIELVPPTDEMIFHGMLANYNIPQLPHVQICVPADLNNPEGEWLYKDVPFDLSINIVPTDEKISPQFGLASWNGFDEEILAFSLPNKPSGATSIVAEYSLDGGKSWQTSHSASGNNLIELGCKPDRVPKQENFAAPLFFDNNQTPMKEYLADNSKTFLVRLNIDGGVYDGISEAFSWPGNYSYSPPIYIDTGSDGGDGNRGDVGSGDGGNGGERPELPNSKPNPTPNPTPESAPNPLTDTKPEAALPPPTSEPPAKPQETVDALSPIQKPSDVFASTPPDREIASEEALPPSLEEPSAPPESSASVKSTEPSEQTMKPVREPNAERAVSPLAVTVIAAAAIAVVGGTIVLAGGAGTISTLSAKAVGLMRKLISFFTHPEE